MKVETAKVEKYIAKLIENSRPPSRGGNTKAWHSHHLIINGLAYSFRALGSKQWVFKSDAVSFDWNWDESQKYRNVDTSTLIVRNSEGEIVVRGHRGTKKWRTAPARMPVSRREMQD